MASEQSENEELKNQLSKSILRRLRAEKQLRLERFTNSSEQSDFFPEPWAELPLVVITHIQKTAGSSMTYYLKDRLKDEDFVSIHTEFFDPVQKVKDYGLHAKKTAKVLIGHFLWSSGVAQCIEYPVVNVTVLRDPVDRFISHYSYLIQIRDVNPQGQFIYDNEISLEQFAESPTTIECDNWFVRMLCDEPLDAIGLGECNEQHLEQAKRNLVMNFDLVGFTEEFDDFMQVLSALLMLDGGPIPRLNPSFERKALSDVSPETINTIRRTHRFDQELFEFARKHFVV